MDAIIDVVLRIAGEEHYIKIHAFAVKIKIVILTPTSKKFHILNYSNIKNKKKIGKMGVKANILFNSFILVKMYFMSLIIGCKKQFFNKKPIAEHY